MPINVRAKVMILSHRFTLPGLDSISQNDAETEVAQRLYVLKEGSPPGIKNRLTSAVDAVGIGAKN